MRLLPLLPVLFLISALLAVGGAAPVRAQEAVFVQIEARPGLAEATERARAYSQVLEDANGFALGGRWFAITLGPYAPEEARARLRRLRGQGLIPQDSYLSDGSGYGARFWPVGGAARRAAPAPVAPRVEAPAIADTPEETPRQARRSESLLTRAERMDLQRALEWFGFYNAAIDGSFGRGTRASMADWQAVAGVQVSGVLTTRQRGRLLREYAASQAELGLARLEVPAAGLTLTAPLALVAFDRTEAPFVHYLPKDGSGVRMSLISQPGDATDLAALYEILQTLDVVPTEGDRALRRTDFRISGRSPGRTTEVFARLEAGHIHGYLLSWPAAQDTLAARALPEMERTLASTGTPLPPNAGFAPDAQRPDRISGLDVRSPIRSASGFFVDGGGAVLTAAANVAGCARVTIDGRHDMSVIAQDGDIAVLRPDAAIAPLDVARLAPAPGRLRSSVAVGGFPYGGVLGGATLTFGTLQDVRGLDGDAGVLRLGLVAQPGDAGGPILDPAGRVTAMLLPRSDTGPRLPQGTAFGVAAPKLAAVLSDAGIAATEARQSGAAIAPEDLTALAERVTVLVGCWDQAG